MNKKTTEKKKGQVVTVNLKRNGGTHIEVVGKVKDTRSSFGHTDYLITKGKTTDFWTREV